MFKVVLSTILGVSHGLDLWEILNADITCCPQSTTQSRCEAEVGSKCVWIADGDAFDQALAAAEGTGCVGAKFYACKTDAGDVDACCAPGCPGKSAPAPPPGSPITGPGVAPPNCGPAHCELGTNYEFEGRQCILSGDPHSYLPNGDKHDFQGTPAINFGTADNPVLKNQFFYFHPCNGANLEQIPIKVLGTHYHWGTRSVSGIDYLTVILTDGRKEFNIFLSSGLHQYGQARGTSTNYDNNDPADLVSLTSGSTTHIGTRFKVFFHQLNSKAIWVKITVDDKEEFTIYMAGQTSFVGGRYRMHYVQMNPPSSMKCHACGLCGDYKRYSTGLHVKQLEACDGSLIDYRAGWNPAATPEAYDADGWTWEYNFVMNDCSTYDITDNIPDEADPTDPCDPFIADQVAAACETAVAAQSTCCNAIGGTFCDGLLTACKVDACAGANGDVTAIDDEVQAVTTDAIVDVCNNADLRAGEEPQPALQCPPGSIVNTGASGTYNDIPGCGLQACSDRYTVDTIEDCEKQCRQNPKCKGFTWAPLNGDKNHDGVRVCTMYNSDTATSTWGPDHIFCALQETTCSLTSYNVGDDITYIYLSRDGGLTEELIQTFSGWSVMNTLEIDGITENTIIKYKMQNNGGPGGFAATLDLVQDQDNTQSVQIVTDAPLTNFEIVATTSGTTDRYDRFGHSGTWDSSWNRARYPQMSEDSYINRVDSHSYTVYQIDFSEHARELQSVGCFEPATVAAEVVMHCDNTGTLQLSTNGGASYQDIKTETNWGIPLRYTVEAVTANTRLRVKCVDVGYMGGFIATVNMDGIGYSTSNPIENGNWKLVSASDGVTSPLDYKCKTCSPWRISTPDIAADAVWIWNGRVHNTLVFEFDFANIMAMEKEMDVLEEYAADGVWMGYRGLSGNSLLVKGCIGVMVLLCVFAVYVRNRKKGKEYMALKEEALSGDGGYNTMYNQV